MKIQSASSLDKIFPDGGVTLPESDGVMLKNERYHFQVAACNEAEWRVSGVSLRVAGDIADFCTVRAVGCVPAAFTSFAFADDYVIFPRGNDSRLYPDVLREGNYTDLPSGKWAAFWVTVHCKSGLPAGKHVLHLTLRGETGETLGQCDYTLEVLDAVLPQDDFPVTHWMHYDAIANYYRVKPWSKAYYAKLGSFIDRAVSHGINMLYVPLFTPPLDTYVGGERLDVQLVKVTKKGGKYTFDLSELETFLDFALRRGVQYFEMCHLATQWGAEHCPKVMATTENSYERIFGWDMSSTSEKYLLFLQQCLGAVDTLLREKGIADKCYFHISDEPNKDNIARYKEVYAAIRPIVKNYKLMDAVGEVGRDIIDVPVVATSHIEGKCGNNEFAYYCCSQCAEYLSNRFLNMPSERNRILGCQLWLNEAKGFLHWGFNFYNDGLSHRSIDPLAVTDAGGQFPAGDSFVVYPSENGALDSLRLEVFYDALQDRKLLCALERKYSRKKIERLLTDKGVRGWKTYPHSARWQIGLNRQLRKMLAEK